MENIQDKLRRIQESTPDVLDKLNSAINHERVECDRIAEQLFYDNADCYTMLVIDVNEIPAMSKEKFTEIVGKIIYDCRK